MSWYDPTTWFDEELTDADVTPEAEAAGFASQAEYDGYIYDQSVQTLALAEGRGADQVELGMDIVRQSQATYAANVNADVAPYLSASGGSLGHVLDEVRAGLDVTRQAATLGRDIADTVGEPYQVGTGRNAVTVLPSRTTGDGRPGTISGATGTPWGQALNDVAANPQKLVVSVAAGLAMAWAVKRLLRAA